MCKILLSGCMLPEPDDYDLLLVRDSQLLNHAACAEAGLGLLRPDKLARSVCDVFDVRSGNGPAYHEMFNTCFYSEETHRVYPGP